MSNWKCRLDKLFGGSGTRYEDRGPYHGPAADIDAASSEADPFRDPAEVDDDISEVVSNPVVVTSAEPAEESAETPEGKDGAPVEPADPPAAETDDSEEGGEDDPFAEEPEVPAEAEDSPSLVPQACCGFAVGYVRKRDDGQQEFCRTVLDLQELYTLEFPDRSDQEILDLIIGDMDAGIIHLAPVVLDEFGQMAELLQEDHPMYEIMKAEYQREVDEASTATKDAPADPPTPAADAPEAAATETQPAAKPAEDQPQEDPQPAPAAAKAPEAPVTPADPPAPEEKPEAPAPEVPAAEEAQDDLPDFFRRRVGNP